MTETVITEQNEYGTIVTTQGAAIIADCIFHGTKLPIVAAGAGDGGGAPTAPVPSQTALVNERWRGEIAGMEISSTTPNMIDVKIVIGEDVGGFTIREMGLFSDTGVLIAVCNTPDTEKVSIADGVSGKLTMIMHIVVADASVLDFVIDPTLDVVYHEELEQALAVKQDKLTGVPGQVVGFDADGAAAAQDGWSNRNLLDNWYFADPINQRGATEYTSAAVSTEAYTIDRWRCAGTLTVEDDHISVVNTATSTFSQRLDLPNLYRGNTLTFSVQLALDISYLTLYIRYNSYLDVVSKTFTDLKAGDVISVSGTVPDRDLSLLWVQVSSTANNTFGLAAAKLELGSVQTLAHKEGDTWVLNDPPPNKALERAKCQRHYCGYPAEISAPLGFGYVYNGSLRMAMVLPVPMRATPTLICSNVTGIEFHGTSGTIYHLQAIPSFKVTGNIISFIPKIEDQAVLTAGNVYIMRSQVKLGFSADL